MPGARYLWLVAAHRVVDQIIPMVLISEVGEPVSLCHNQKMLLKFEKCFILTIVFSL